MRFHAATTATVGLGDFHSVPLLRSFEMRSALAPRPTQRLAHPTARRTRTITRWQPEKVNPSTTTSVCVRMHEMHAGLEAHHERRGSPVPSALDQGLPPEARRILSGRGGHGGGDEPLLIALPYLHHVGARSVARQILKSIKPLLHPDIRIRTVHPLGTLECRVNLDLPAVACR